MQQPDELKLDQPLKWSSGRGTDVWALFCACVDGDLDAARQLLERDPSLARSHCHYRKPLYFAVRENRVAIAELLLRLDPDPFGLAVNDSLLEICRDRGYREMERLLEATFAERFGASPRGEPAAAAIRRHDLPGLRALLDASPELLHAGDSRSNQPIHWAVMTRQPEFIDELLGRGADINARRSDCARPIHLTNGDYHFRGWRDVPKDWPKTPAEIYQHLLARGANVDLGMACATGDLARVRELLDREPALVNRVSDYGGYYIGSGAPIKNAAARGHLEVVRFLLERGADPNLPEEGIAPDGHALYSAAANGHHDIVALLLEKGGQPNAAVESSADALSRAIMNGDQRMIDLLCAHGAARPVHLLAYYNDLRTAAAVFAANPALAKDPEALANAASEGHEAFVRLMLKYEPNLPRHVTFPAWAVGSKTLALDELLFQHGMNPSAPNWLGITPLHELARQGNVEKATLFLDRGADLHARDEDLCSTPLGWAAKSGKLEMVELLLQRGALPQHPDDSPWATPLAWAQRRQHPSVVEILLRQGAKPTPVPPAPFSEAVIGLMNGDFSRLAPLFGRQPDGSPAPILHWYEAGWFGHAPDALKEAFTCACFNGCIEVAERLLADGVDPSGGAATGLNAAHWAANRGQLAVVRLLLQYRAPLETLNRYGGTVLGCTVWSGVHEPKPDHPAIVSALLGAGADISKAAFPSGSDAIDALLRRHLQDAARPE